MTDTQRKETRKHLMHGLALLADQDRDNAFVVENCPDETDFASQLTRQGVNLAVQNRRV